MNYGKGIDVNSGIDLTTARNFSYAFMVPVFLSTIFQIPHWWKMEETMKRRIFTLPLLMAQFWPQSCMLRILYMGWKKDVDWAKKKALLEKDVFSIGKILLKLTGGSRKSIWRDGTTNFLKHNTIYH